MKKLRFIFGGLLLNSLCLNAIEPGKFIFGINSSSGSGEIEETTGSKKTNNKFDTKSNSLKIAYTLENDNRFVFSYEIMEKEFEDSSVTWYGKNNPELVFYNFDWQFIYPKESFSPYWTIGLAEAILKNSGPYLLDGNDLEGISFNFGAGVLYNISTNVELELMYNFKSIGWENVGTTTTTETTSSISQIALGVNLIF